MEVYFLKRTNSNNGNGNANDNYIDYIRPGLFSVPKPVFVTSEMKPGE